MTTTPEPRHDATDERTTCREHGGAYAECISKHTLAYDATPEPATSSAYDALRTPGTELTLHYADGSTRTVTVGEARAARTPDLDALVEAVAAAWASDADPDPDSSVMFARIAVDAVLGELPDVAALTAEVNRG
ncbi:hypothetical protein [Luteipulveratus halotolerans]|uniref:Uncharacterized protein n=1 Tax=Luteipulveratus halotolerans TaxID=1631356 RepID=A0A0L6CKP2_9MICO|nr:hypothetical protein [Luteipulveratus halotolerans]KNX38078.1 hypothetical protein VV01_14500 [Luteipulveratus halotolerans]